MKKKLEEFEILTQKGRYEYRVGNNEKSIEYHKRALDLAEKSKNKRNILICEKYIGTSYYRLGNYRKSLKNYERAEQIAQKENFDLEIPRIKNHISNVYIQFLNFEDAEKEILDGLDKCKNIDSKNNLNPKFNKFNKISFIKLYNTYAVINLFIGRKDIAGKYLKKAQKINNKYGEERNKGTTEKLLGGFYLDNNNITQAEKHLNKAIEIGKKIKDYQLIVYPKFKLAQCAFQKRKFNQALEIIDELEFKYSFFKIETNREMINFYLFKTYCLIELKNFEKCFQNLNMAEMLLDESNYPYGKLVLFELLADFSFRKKKYLQVILYLQEILNIFQESKKISDPFSRSEIFNSKIEMIRNLIKKLQHISNSETLQQKIENLNSIYQKLNKVKTNFTKDQLEFLDNEVTKTIDHFSKKQIIKLSNTCYSEFKSKWKGIFSSKFPIANRNTIHYLIKMQFDLESTDVYEDCLDKLFRVVELELKIHFTLPFKQFWVKELNSFEYFPKKDKFLSNIDKKKQIYRDIVLKFSWYLHRKSNRNPQLDFWVIENLMYLISNYKSNNSQLNEIYKPISKLINDFNQIYSNRYQEISIISRFLKKKPIIPNINRQFRALRNNFIHINVENPKKNLKLSFQDMKQIRDMILEQENVRKNSILNEILNLEPVIEFEIPLEEINSDIEEINSIS